MSVKLVIVKMKCGSLCTGHGGLELALENIFPDRQIIWTAETDPAANKVIQQRFPGVPNLGDVKDIKWTAELAVDVLTAGFPCQDVSMAGARKGLTQKTRTGLWYEVLRAINDLKPKIVVLENVRGLFTAKTDQGTDIRALGVVLRDLAATGYDAQWRSVRACDAGLPHQRERVVILARRRA